jgi:serine phosphatase RsbU (regulator of sigma subunit)
MEKRKGSSLSSKMILGTSGLILVIVALFGIINATHMRSIYDEQSRRLSQVFLEDLTKRGDVQTRDLAQTSRTAILQNDYSTLQTFVPQLAPKGDREVAYAFVADRDGTVLAHSDSSLNGKPLSDQAGRELIAATSTVSKKFGNQMAFSRPIEHEGQKVGTVAIAFHLKPLDEQIARINEEKIKAATAAVRNTGALGLVFMLFGTALAVFQGLRISRPLTMLAWRADQIAGGDLSARVEVASSDEIGQLGESFNFMADQLTVLLRETAEKAVLEKEQEGARAIQETLVPPPDLIERRGIRLSGYFMPSSQCGGDWWTYHDLPGDRILVMIGDVTGHGIPAAMITATAKAACDTVRTVAGEKLNTAYLLEILNRAIYESARRKFFMTCFASIIDMRARTITYANAGHNFPYLLRAKHDPSATNGEGQEFQVLMSRGNPLGDVIDSTYVEKTQQLEPGDVVVWYTDGIVECENDHGEEYGEKRFRAAIRKAVSLDPPSMRDSVVQTAGQFFGGRARKDDITMVFARVTA